MGIAFSQIWGRLFGMDEMKILILGLDNAGKTTILYKITMGEVVATAPTVGSNNESYTFRNLKFNLWDIGGQTALRQSWAQYFTSARCVILVVDSTDRARIGLVKAELGKLLEAEVLEKTLLLVMANKQDVKGCMTAGEISQGLALTDLKDREWQILATSALTGQGLEEGLDWMATRLAAKK